jgi:hypothetical protein
MNLLSRLQAWLRPTPVVDMALRYTVDLDEQGRHLVRVFRQENGKDIPVNKVEDLLRYD